MAEPASRSAARHNHARSGNDGTQPPKRGRQVLKIVAVVVLAALVLGLSGLGIAYTQIKLPDPNRDFSSNTSYVYFRDGKTQMGNFALQNRQSISYAEMPQDIKDAVVAAENRTFWTDKGISITGMIRALITIARGGDTQGGSTITQQYIKILYLTSERTMTRKVKELFLATKLGREVPKEQILEGYLNTIYFGRGAYGIQAASKAYYNIDAKDLTVPQAAFLATVLNNPGAFDPSDPDNATRIMDRYHYVLNGMVEMGKLSPGEAGEYGAKLPDFPKIPVSQRYAGPQGYLLRMVEAELQAKGMSQAEVYGGGLKIVTTFDQNTQNAAVKTAEDYTKRITRNAGKGVDANKLHAAIASVDNANGEVVALYGGKDYIADSRNWATTARQTGSTYKPFALAAGLRDGFAITDRFQGNTFTPKGDTVPARNEFGMSYGNPDLIEATAQSINTAYVDLTTQMSQGPQKIITAAADAGAPKGAGSDPNSNRITLGIPEVTPLNMASAYATFANNGKRVPPHVVREVFDAKGNSIYKADTGGKQVFDANLCRDVTYAMEQVVQRGTATRVQSLGRPAAGKTGTAGLGDDVISSWFVGYTKQISTAVMYVAGDDGMSDLDPYARGGDATFFGGSYPAMTWTDFMEIATKGQKELDFDPPAYINGGKRRSTYVPPRTSAAPKPSATKAPSTQAPSTQAPTTQAPTTQAPQTQKPPTQQQPQTQGMQPAR